MFANLIVIITRC